MILPWLLPWIAAAFVLALALSAWRLLRGPTLPDRILALDSLSINALALMVVAGLWWADKLYFEFALLIALLGFISTVVLARFVLRGAVIE